MKMSAIVFLGMMVPALFGWSAGFVTEGAMQRDHGYGMRSYRNETVDAVTVNGMATLENTQVRGNTCVNGSLRADNSEMTELQVNGQAVLKNCLVRGNVVINGFLNAEDSKFYEGLSVSSQKTVFSNCSVASLRIRDTSSYGSVQIVELHKGTKINGPIVIDSGNGEVWLFSNSEVTGDVVGAKVIKK
jgi:hypothetical protein